MNALKQLGIDKPIFLIALVLAVVLGLSLSGCGGGNSDDEATWDANTALTGMTVEGAWDEIENQGYTLDKILSTTGSELNSSEDVRHSSTAQTWRVKEAELDGDTGGVTITVTSRDDFVETMGEDLLR